MAARALLLLLLLSRLMTFGLAEVSQINGFGGIQIEEMGLVKS